MNAQLLRAWERLRTSYWFVPTLMAVTAALLAFASVRADEALGGSRLGAWTYTGSAEGARAVLQTVAGSMITIAGVVFSITLVALSLASSQFGPRLLRNFIKDTGNQLVLGTFIATFVFCLFVLRAIRGDGSQSSFIPHLSVTLGVVMAFVSLWVLIWFIHHVAVSIQADRIIARVGEELEDGIERLFPEHIGEARPLRAAPGEAPVAGPDAGDPGSACVRASRDGYLQIVDADTLMQVAQSADAVIRILRRPGHYVSCGMPVALLSPHDRADRRMLKRLAAAFVIGSQRTPEQDIEFAIMQLVEIATRALSPGVNEPFTAIACIDRLGSALCRLAQREMPAERRYSDERRLRVVAPATTFADVVDATLDQVRQNARGSAAVSIRLLETIAAVAPFASRAGDRDALRRHADMVLRGASAELPEVHDRQALAGRHRAAIDALNDPAPR